MEHLFSAGIIVYRMHNDIREYLLLKYGAGHWDFAKGKIEKGETKEQAALRELHEEAGISADIDTNFEESFSYIFHNYDKQLAKKTVYFFVGYATSTHVTLSHEHTDFAWLPYSDALEQLTYDNAKNILEKADQYIIRSKL